MVTETTISENGTHSDAIRAKRAAIGLALADYGRAVDAEIARATVEAMHVAASERLGERRNIIAALKTDDVMCEAVGLIEDLRAALGFKLKADARVRASRIHLEEAKALVYLSGTIDGKNEAQRSAQLVIALRDDPDYQTALADLGDAETAVEQAAAQLEVIRRQLDANRARGRIVAGTLELMAGE